MHATCLSRVILFDVITTIFDEACNGHLCLIMFCGNRTSLQNVFVLKIQSLFQLSITQRNNTDLILCNCLFEKIVWEASEAPCSISLLHGLLAGWFKSLLPKSALTVEEEAWNAYPYTKTRYTCPFVEKFSLEIETYYYADNGHQENVFGLSGSDLRNRVIGM